MEFCGKHKDKIGDLLIFAGRFQDGEPFIHVQDLRHNGDQFEWVMAAVDNSDEIVAEYNKAREAQDQ